MQCRRVFCCRRTMATRFRESGFSYSMRRAICSYAAKVPSAVKAGSSIPLSITARRARWTYPKESGAGWRSRVTGAQRRPRRAGRSVPISLPSVNGAGGSIGAVAQAKTVEDAGEDHLANEERGDDGGDIRRRQRQQAAADEQRQQRFRDLIEAGRLAAGWQGEAALHEAGEEI